MEYKSGNKGTRKNIEMIDREEQDKIGVYIDGLSFYFYFDRKTDSKNNPD